MIGPILAGIAALMLVAVAMIGIRPASNGGPSPAGKLVYLASLIATLAILISAGPHLLPGTVSTLELPLGIPWLGVHLRIDALSAFFLVVVNLGGALTSLYALGYGRHERSPGRVLPFFPAFLAGMNLVLLADDAFTFLFAWEFMSLTSWALVMAHHRESENIRAGLVYLVMAGFGTLTLLLAFGFLAAAAGDYSFQTMREAEITPAVTAVVLILSLMGAGSKAGIVPLHVWLPLAHPAAPSHVSALMSGVMTKVAIYGLIRIVFELSGTPTWWAGLLVLLIGGITALLGVLHALMQHDLKRLLAYHTVENIGIIFIGLGLALAFIANEMPAAAALAFTAALFHVFNHSLFKSLLFFGAGAVLTATGKRDMEQLGGLIHRMPVTAALFLVGCVAISALPPLNGFVSEWLTFQAILLSVDLPQWGLKLLVPAVGTLLALAAALAAACFVKAYGVTFLGRPRSEAAANAVEVDRFSLSAMGILALLCLAAGILPGVVIDSLAAVSQMLVGEHMPVQSQIAWGSIVPIAESRSSYNGLLVLVFIALSASVAAVAIHRLASRRTRRAPAWDCGYPEPTAATQYSASSFAQPIRRVYGSVLFAAREQVEMPPPAGTGPARHQVRMTDPSWTGLHDPLIQLVDRISGLVNRLQFLTLRRYLAIVLGTLIALLLVLALWS